MVQQAMNGRTKLTSRDRWLFLLMFQRRGMTYNGLLLKQSALFLLGVDTTSAVSDSRLSFKQLITFVL